MVVAEGRTHLDYRNDIVSDAERHNPIGEPVAANQVEQSWDSNGFVLLPICVSDNIPLLYNVE